MRVSFLFVILLTVSIFPKDISLSKDSLKVYNWLASSFMDYVIIKNNSGVAIALDSAYLAFDSFDTTGLSSYLLSGEKIETHWIEDENKSDFGWHLNELGNNKFKLVKDYFSPNNDAPPLRCAPHDSCDLNYIQIGFYLISAHYPLYPKYLKGSLLLYFNNKETVEIKLYSSDLRTKVSYENRVSKRIENDYKYECFSLNGRTIVSKSKNAKNLYVLRAKENKSFGVKMVNFK